MPFEIQNNLELILGILIAFFGWILYWAGLSASGILLGFLFGASIGVFISAIMGIASYQYIVIIIAGVLGGVFGRFVARQFH